MDFLIGQDAAGEFRMFWVHLQTLVGQGDRLFFQSTVQQLIHFHIIEFFSGIAGDLNLGNLQARTDRAQGIFAN